MSNYETYEEWLEDLQEIADIFHTDLHADKYHYHTYFMRGWLPESVFQDLILLERAE